MSDRRAPFARGTTLLATAAATILCLFGWAAAPTARGAAPPAARSLCQLYFSNALVRAEVVSIVGKVEHDYRVDAGRVVAVRANAIDLLERDGTRQTITIAAQTQLVGIGRLFAPGALPRGVRVITVRDGSGAAQQVRPYTGARILCRSLLGNTLVRAEVLNYVAKTVHDYRIDEGRIVAVKPAAVTLLERDGTRQAIPVASSTLITLGGFQVDQSAVVKGLDAITIREGDGAAEQIMLGTGPFAVRR